MSMFLRNSKLDHFILNIVLLVNSIQNQFRDAIAFRLVHWDHLLHCFLKNVFSIHIFHHENEYYLLIFVAGIRVNLWHVILLDLTSRSLCSCRSCWPLTIRVKSKDMKNERTFLHIGTWFLHLVSFTDTKLTNLFKLLIGWQNVSRQAVRLYLISCTDKVLTNSVVLAFDWL